VSEGTESPSEVQQQDAFESDPITPGQLAGVKEGLGFMHLGQAYQWRLLEEKESFINLDAFYSAPEYVYAYAYAEINMLSEGKRLVGVGSDDAIKIWLNGDLVHEKYVFRGHNANEDIVELNFKKGKNALLVKVLDARLGWGFSINFLTVDQLPDLLVAAAYTGQIDMAKLLLANHANPNTPGTSGLTPWQAARIKGRIEMCDLLKKQGAKTDLPFPAPDTMVERLFRKITDGEKPGAAVLVAQNGKILYQHGFGYANIEKDIPVTPETKFRIGSITKQFTAAAILKLVEKGKMKLDDKLSKYIPDFPRGDEVTIYHLLTHTSGFNCYTEDAGFVERVTQPITTEELINEFKTYDFDFEPGTQWSYCNSGYFILGYLVEQVSGMSYPAFLKKTFFQPLGMKNTGVHVRGKTYKNEAFGYDAEDPANIKPSLDWNMAWAGGAGNLYSTVGDLFLWNEAVFNDKVLKPETLKAAHTPASLNNGEIAQSFTNGGYGFGWAITEFRGEKEITHSGGLHGWLTNLSRIPKENLTVAVLTNCTPPIDKSPTQFTYDLIEFFIWEKLGDQESFAVQNNIDFDLYDDYAGYYEYPGGVLMEVTRDGNRLIAQLAGQPAFEIFPQADSKFFWKVVDAQIEFFRDESGAVTHGIHTQGGQTIQVPKVGMDVAAEVDPALYDRYIGEYQLGPATITVTKEGSSLFVQSTGQPAFEIFPKSETEFFLKVVKATITFEMDETGKVTGLTLDQGGIKQTAKKM